MPDFLVLMNFNGTVHKAKRIKPLDAYPHPWDHWAITNKKYGPLTNEEDNEIGIMIIRRTKDMVTAIKEADEARKQAIEDGYCENITKP